MPCTFLSHQAAVLPLKMTFPRWTSGTALVLGSMAPDFEFALNGRMAWGVGHAVVGQFVFCLPVTLLLALLITRVVARPLALHLPDGGAFHLQDYSLVAETSKRSGYWLKVIPSALIGSFSHIGWDSFTHGVGWTTIHLGYAGHSFRLAGHSILITKALQHGSTAAGAILTILMLYHIGKHRLILRWAGIPEPSSRKTAPCGNFLFWLPAIAGFVAALAVARWTNQLHGASGLLASGFRALGVAFIGLCVSSAVWNYRQRAGRRVKREG